MFFLYFLTITSRFFKKKQTVLLFCVAKNQHLAVQSYEALGAVKKKKREREVRLPQLALSHKLWALLKARVLLGQWEKWNPRKKKATVDFMDV